MTPERAKEILPFVEAAARGKTLQYRTANGDQWMDHDDILFTAPIDQYRIKPEPREWVLWVNEDGRIREAEGTRSQPGNFLEWTKVCVREIIET